MLNAFLTSHLFRVGYFTHESSEKDTSSGIERLDFSSLHSITPYVRDEGLGTVIPAQLKSDETAYIPE